MNKLPKSICFSKKKQINHIVKNIYNQRNQYKKKKQQPINKQTYTKGNKQKQNKQNTK